MEYDSTTGLYYDHARYYDSVVGRFVSQDPEGFAAGDTDLYRYVGNNPTGGTDTSGYQGPGSKDPGDLNPGNPLEYAWIMYRFSLEKLEEPPVLRPEPPDPGNPTGPVYYFRYKDPVWTKAVGMYLRRILTLSTSTLGDWPSGPSSGTVA